MSEHAAGRPATISHWFDPHVRAVTILQCLAILLVVLAIVMPFVTEAALITVSPVLVGLAGIVYGLSHVVTLMVLQIETLRETREKR
jgi:hypothetical protein